ncbi:Autophagy-related protein 2 [Trichoderma ghanense]|uniref:Autophagy-related protein 2 n=1 Tax=Trichoderma ghanense TaxID=65468 RepID=A0ABY2HJ78_9HYPO
MGLLGGLWCRRSAAAIGIAALGVAPVPDLYLSGYLSPFTSFLYSYTSTPTNFVLSTNLLWLQAAITITKRQLPSRLSPPASPSGQTLLRLLASTRNPSPFMPRFVSRSAGRPGSGDESIRLSFICPCPLERPACFSLPSSLPTFRLDNPALRDKPIMAGLFQSFRSSSMPKRLLRYALSRLELLDSDALDMDNLDLALGRNTVFEFRDVGVQLDLEKLLKLPKTFALQKAKVLLLRVTIPMDFYTSPISIEVDGVDVKLKVVVPDAKAKSGHPTTTTSDDDDASAAVPNTVDLAQSFLETQPSSERRKLEAALAAETQDLGASGSMSDDSSEDEPVVGTGQPLSLPGFLAGFLQGIVDRMQIKIQGVAFQLDMDIPVDISAAATEPVSFQIALEGIDIEGVTTKSEGSRASAVAAPKEGKRQISLDNVRAYLISEANVFSTLTRSSSMTSPSAASSPVHTRNPPSRQATHLSLESFQEPAFEPTFAPSFVPSALPSHSGYLDQIQESPRESVHGQQMSTSQASSSNPSIQSLHASFLGHGTDMHESDQPSYPLADSEEALGIPYEFECDGGLDDECPATPRASQSREFNSPEDAIFHSPEDPALNPSPILRRDFDDRLSVSQDYFGEQEMASSSLSQHQEGLEDFGIYGLQSSPDSGSEGRVEPGDLVEDLAQSHLYTHEEAESMYMSAFSKAGGQSSDDISELESSRHTLHPADVEEHTLHPADVEERTLSPADVEEHTLPPADVEEHTLHPVDVEEHAPPPADVEERTHPSADMDEHTLPLADVEEHTLSPLDVDEHTSPSADVGEHTLPPSDVDRHTNESPTEENTELMRTPQAPQGKFSQPPAPFTMPGGWDDDASQYLAETDRAASPAPRTEGQQSTRKSISEQQPQPVPEAGAEPAAESAFEQQNPSSPVIPRAPAGDEGGLRDAEEESSQLEDTATPKGPTRVVKEILHLQSVSVYIPTAHQHIELDEDTSESVAELARAMSNSVYPQAPGAFSVHAPVSGSVFEHRPHLQQTQSVDNVLEVDLSPVSIRFDASLAFVLAMIVGKLLDAVKSKHPVAKPHQGADTAQQQEKVPEVRVTVQEVSVDFLNRLAGVADTPRRHLDPSAFMFDHEVLLNATLRNLGVSVSPVKIPSPHAAGGRGTGGEVQDAVQTRIDVETFRFGYSNGDIISFDKAAQMSTSVRDTFLSNGHDIAIKMAQAKDSIRTEIETLPLVVHVDLQRLDETFSWFGGLSSFLNMSASMTSSPSPTPKSPSKPAQRPKGVRFETPINPDDKSAVSENKINMRIGGSYIELVGRECSFVAESNAIKFINRERGAGVSCSRMRVSGPYLKNSMAKPAINTEIGGVRLEFVTTPNDSDLERLLGLITPSKAKFDHGSDEIMVDTLIRQRRKGSVLRVGVETLNVRVKNLAQLEVLPALAEELAKLSTVAKYLPEDDRPGLMTLAKVQELGASVELGGTFGQLSGELKELEAAHISIPSLVAVAVSGISVKRNKTEELISSSVLYPSAEIANRGPVIMARMIGDDIEPIVKLNLQDISIEYRVPTIMDILGLANDATPQDFEESLAASVASLGDQAHAALARQQPLSPTHAPSKQSKPLTLDVSFRDCLVGLNPLNQKSKMVLVFTDARLAVVLPKDEVTQVTLDVNKASILLTDDASLTSSDYRPSSSARRRASSSASPQAVSLSAQGFVDICYMSSAKVTVVVAPGIDGEKQVEVEVRDDLLVLETCADSTQTLISLANALSPPTPPSKENKYRTKVMPVQDLLASISAEAFGKPEGEYDFDQDFAGAQEMAKSQSEADFGVDNNFPIESQFYGDETDGEELFDAMKLSATSRDTRMQDTQEGVLITGLDRSRSYVSEGSDDLAFKEDFFNDTAPDEHGAKIWNSIKNSYDKAPPNLVKRSPLKVSVRDVHVIWNLFDGYDWTHTRDTISKAVHDVETKVYERQARLGGRQVFEEEIEDEETIGDFLFNSIYIGIPASRDPQELSRAINEGLADNATETESIATTAVTTSTNRTVRRGHPKSRRLKLQRSKHHKITFELQGVNVDMVAFPPGTGETQSSVDIRVQNLDIFDHVPTSTWKKFVTYDRDQGEREMGTSMVHLELLTVKPLPELGASEIVLRATVLPLRLHVDQDALDFITRFFEFKDDSVPVHSSPSDVPFLQRAEVHDIPVKLDFKPKRVDYAGLRSGHTTEFMNFITLEESRMVLRHTIIYGVSGFDRLGKTLNDIWTPDVRNNQLPGVVAGLAPVRSLVNIGSGFKDLIEIPLKEYQKDGRIIRSISKGAAAFARTTGTELVKFGAKLAVGTQYALQGAEDMLTTGIKPDDGWDDDDPDAEDKKQISIYADHPTGVIQGIRGGYRSLARDVNLARDAIIAVPGEVMESQTATGAAKAVLRRAPTIIFRPAVGVSKAIGQTLMGATNSIDPHNQRRIDEKYKKH